MISLKLALTLQCVAVSLGSKITLVSSPTRVLSGLDDKLTLRCDVKDTSASGNLIGKRDVTQTSGNAQEVTSLVIMKNGVDIASVSHLQPAHIIDGSVNTQVTGQVSKVTGGNGFLELTFLKPDASQIGEFICEANALVQGGHVTTFSTSLEVEISTPTQAELITYMKQELDRLKQTVMFSVASTVNEVIPAGQNVMYDKVFTNVGGGFNVSSGEFVCPVAGFYQFEIHALTTLNTNFWLDLKQNEQVTVSIHGATTDYQGSSNSVILQVQKGDVLKVVAMQDSQILAVGSKQVYDSFSGHLLSVL